ncbi:MAG: permease prefix domain 1-containing protein [Planctomycetaceae bacterium]
MSEREFELYLSLMSKLLRLGPEQTASISDELRDHFDERFEDLCRQGVPREQAIRQALDEFGDAAGLAADFTHLARTRRRRLIMRFSLATVFLAAAALMITRAVLPPNPIINGPAPVIAQEDAKPVTETLDVPAPEPPKSIDPATLIPAPLAKRITWEFSDLPLKEMVNEFAERIEMPVYIREDVLSDIGIPMDEPVEGRINDLPAYLLLDRVFAGLGLSWYVDDGILNITSGKDADKRYTLDSYVITDLLDRGYTVERLRDLTEEMTEGPWQNIDGHGGTWTAVGDVVLMRQTDRVHREVAGLFQALRQNSAECYSFDPPIHQALRSQLDEIYSVDFKEVPLSSAILWLESETGLQIGLAEDILNDVGVPADEPVSLVLKGRSLRTIFKYLLERLGLTVIPQDGQLLVTSQEDAEETLRTVVYNVSDVVHSIDDAQRLIDAIQEETEGPWEDIDGIGGLTNAPIDGVLVIRQTEKVLQEVRELLAAYRQARVISPPRDDRSDNPAEMAKLETRYYHMNADTARDLQKQLPVLVQPGTWLGFGVSNEIATVGQVSMVSTDPKTETLPGRDISRKTKDRKEQDGEEPADEQQPDVLVIPQAVLIINHTKATHREIEQLLREVSNGKITSHGGAGGGRGFF